MSDLARRSEGYWATEHCDNDTLYALLRRTLSKEEAHRVIEHLRGCAECMSRFDSFKMLVGQLTAKEEYRSLVPGFLAYIDNPGPAQFLEQKKRQERLHEDILLAQAFSKYVWRKIAGSSARPTATEQRIGRRVLKSFAIVCVTILVLGIVVLAQRVDSIPRNTNPGNGLLTSTSTSPASFPSLPTPTPTPPPTISGTTNATLSLCRWSSNKQFGHLAICGKGFTPNGKVKLWFYVRGNAARGSHPVTVTVTADSNGQFQLALLSIAGLCRSMPITVSATDMTTQKAATNTLTISAQGTCTYQNNTNS